MWWSKSNHTREISLCRKGHRFASAALFTTDSLSAVSAKVRRDKTGLCCILMTADCFYHTPLSSRIPAMFSCCHAAVELERFMRRCFNTARVRLPFVIEMGFFIVMQTGSDLTPALLFSKFNIPHPQYPDSAETVTWQRLWKSNPSTCLIPYAVQSVTTACSFKKKNKKISRLSALFLTVYSNVKHLSQTKHSEI